MSTNKAKYEARPWLKFYLDGVPSDIEILEESVVDNFNRITEKWKGKTALIFYGRKISYGELRDHVDRFATGATPTLSAKRSRRPAGS